MMLHGWYHLCESFPQGRLFFPCPTKFVQWQIDILSHSHVSMSCGFSVFSSTVSYQPGRDWNFGNIEFSGDRKTR